MTINATIANLNSDKNHINSVIKYLPARLDRDKIYKILNHGMFRVTPILKWVVTSLGGNECDLVKYASVSRDHHDARISNIKGDGDLRIQVFVEQTGQYYYFVVSQDACQNAKDTIIISFSRDGRPARTRSHWWSWEVDSFEQMARDKPKENHQFRKLFTK